MCRSDISRRTEVIGALSYFTVEEVSKVMLLFDVQVIRNI